MTDAQWIETRDYLLTRLPKISVWLKDHFTADKRKDIVAGWSRLFDGVTEEAAKAAIDQFSADPALTPQKMSSGDLPSRIARAAREFRRTTRKQYVDGVQTFECPHCEDIGWVMVWSAADTRKARAGTLTVAMVEHYRGCAVQCTCEHGGKAQQKGPYKEAAQRFDPSRMFRLQTIAYTMENGQPGIALSFCTDPIQLDAFQAWVDVGMKPKPHNEFMTFS